MVWNSESNELTVGDDVIQTKEVDDVLHISYSKDIVVELASHGKVEKFNLIFQPRKNQFKFNNPIPIKRDIAIQISNRMATEEIRMFNNMIFVSTGNVETAKEILSMKNIVNIEVDADFQRNSLTSKIVIFDVDPNISLREILGDLLMEKNFPIEIKRLNKRVNGDQVPSSTVFVKIIGKIIPLEMPAGLPWPRYIFYCIASMLSMAAGAQVVHYIYKPMQDLPEYVEREKMKLRKLAEKS